MKATQYLEQRRQGWYFTIDVPRPLRQHVGKKRMIKSLQTRDLKEAQRRRPDMYAEVTKYFALVEDQVASGELVSGPENLIRDAKVFAQDQRLGNATTTTDDWDRGLSAWVDAHADDPQAVDAYRTASNIIHGRVGTLTSDALKVHLEDLRTRNRRESTITTRETKVLAFLKWRGPETELKAITPKDAGRYRTEVLMRSGRALKTIKGDAAHLKAFGGWCVDAGYLDLNPFDRITKRLEDTSRGTTRGIQVRPWEPDELVALLQGIKKHRGTDDPLWGLTVLALFTGCRAEEIATLTKQHCHHLDPIPYIHVAEGKTKSSIRDVPLHPLVVPLVTKLFDSTKSTEEFIIDGLKPGGQDGKRFHGQSKRFATLTRRTLKITDESLRFHSLRHNLATALRRAGVDSDTIQQITGHAQQGSGSFQRYDHGVLLERLHEVVSQVDYGPYITQIITK